MSEKYQKISTNGLLIVDGKILVVKRSKDEDFLAGYYEVPGGKVDFGEDPKDCIKREFMEEVNLKVEVKHLHNIWTYISDEGKRHTVCIDYILELKDSLKNLRLSDAHDDFKWLSAGEIKDLHMTNNMKDILIGALSKKWK